MRTGIRLLAVLGSVFVGLGDVLGAPLTNAVTYQGQLKDAGGPATGTHNITFTLWDAAGSGSPPAGGAQIGAADSNPGTVVTNGLFTVELNDTGQFGAAAFNGEARWLQISVNGTVLSPRQPVTAAPFALYAVNGGAAGHWAANGTSISNTNTGFVGVNRSAPITGAEYFGIQAPAAAGYGGMYVRTDGAAALPFYGYRAGGSGESAWTYLDGASGDWRVNADGDRLTVTDTGEVGIDTTTPRQLLSIGANLDIYSGAANSPTRPSVRGSNLSNLVLGASDAGATYLNFDGGTGGVRIHDGTSAGELMRINGDGSVGIGTTTTSGGKASIHTTTGSALYVTSASNTGPVANFGTGLNSSFSGDVIAATTIGATARAGSFMVANSSNSNAALYCKTTGTGPALWADGLARVKVLEIEGADVAERFAITDAQGAIKPGMVMEIDPSAVGKLRMARGAYSRRVAGVVSGAGDIPTGTILGNMQASAGAPPIALSGRVWVNCDASVHAIEPGDLLTTSETAGHAMKATDSPRAQGAILGKAMSALMQGETGQVLVLVTLQ